MAKKNFLSGMNPNVKYGLIGVLVIVIIAFGKKLLSLFSSGISLIGLSGNATTLSNDLNTNDPNAVRVPFVRSVCESVNSGLSAWVQNESDIVTQMNSLANGKEAAAAAVYYQSAYGTSLKVALQSALHGSWFFPTGGRYVDLKSYVQQNIV